MAANAYQQNLFTPSPVDEKNYSTGDVYGIIARQKEYNPQKAAQLTAQFQSLQATKGTQYYNPYAQATNRAVSNLQAYGIDTSRIDDNFFAQNDYLRQHLIYDGTTNSPTKPGKKATAAQKAAYEYYQIWKAEDATRKAETQWQALQNELSYWAWQPDRNYSDDEIISRIDWSKYSELVSMDENKDFAPNEYNRAIGYSQDAMRGVLWAARNPDFRGTIEDAIGMSALGEGKHWEENAEIAAKLNAGNHETYSPYSVGSTMEDQMVYFGTTGFNQQWLDEHRDEIMGGNDETAKKYFDSIVDAEKYTQKLETELSEMYEDVNTLLSIYDDPQNIIDAIKDSGAYKDLFDLDETMYSGKLKSTTRQVDYRWQDMEQKIREACDKKAELKTTNDIVSWVQDNPEATEAEKALADYYSGKIEGIVTSIKEKGTPEENAVIQTAKVEDFDGAKEVVETTPVTPGKAATDATKLASDELFGLNDIIYDFEQHKADRERAQDELDSLTPEWQALDERYKATQSISEMTPEEYQGFEFMKNLKGDPEWDVIKSYLSRGEESVGVEDYNNALLYLFQHIHPGNEAYSDTETAIAKAKEWWGLMQQDTPQADINGLVEQINRDGGYEDEDLEFGNGRYAVTVDQDEDQTFHFAYAEDKETGKIYGPDEIDDLERAITGKQWLTPEEGKRYEMLSQRRAELEQSIADIDDYVDINQSMYDDAMADKEFLLSAYRSAADMSGGEMDTGFLASLDYGYKVAQSRTIPQWSSYSAYDQAVRDGTMTEEDAATQALASSVFSSGEAQMLTDLMGNLDKYGVKMSDEQRQNIQDRIEYLQRDAKNSAYVAIDNAEDYEEMVERGRELASKSFDILDMAIANGDGINRFATIGLSAEYDDASYMSDREKNRYLYLLGADGKEAAKDYYESLRDPDFGVMNVRRSEEMQKTIRDFAGQNALTATLATAMSVGSNLLGGPAAMFYELSQWVKGEDINPFNQAFEGQIFTQAAREGSKKALHDVFGNGVVVDMVYDALTSSMDSIANAKVTDTLLKGVAEMLAPTRLGKFLTNISDAKALTQNNATITDGSLSTKIGKWLGGGSATAKVGNFAVKVAGDMTHASTMGLNAASAAYREAIIKGATKDQAFGMFLATFFAETGSEAITFSNLHDSFIAGGDEAKRSLSDFVKKFFKNGAEEFFGEGINEYIEQNADRIIMGAMSEYEQMVKSYTDQGYPSSVAKQLVDKELFTNILRAGAIGFISSGIGTSVEYGSGYINERNSNKGTGLQVREIAPEASAETESLLRDRYELQHAEENATTSSPLQWQDTLSAQQYMKDSNTLIGAFNGDSTAAAVSMAAVLGSGNTQTDKAAAQAMVGEMAHNKPKRAARAMQGILTAFRGLQKTPEYQGMSMDQIKSIVSLAALTDGAGHQALETIFNEGAPGGRITQQLVIDLINGVNQDQSANPEALQQAFLNRVRENRVANYTIRNMAEFKPQLETAEAAVRTAQTNLANAQQAANEANATVEAVSENLQNAMEDYMPEGKPINPDAAGTFEQTRNEVLGAITMAEEADNKVMIQQQQVEEAQQKLSDTREELVTQARVQAEADVAKEDQAIQQTLQEQQAAFPATRNLTQSQPIRMRNGQRTQINGVYAVVGPNGQNVGMQGYYEDRSPVTVQGAPDGLSVYSTPLGYITTNDLMVREGVPNPVQQAENGWYERSARNPINPAFWFNHSLQGTDTITGQPVTLMGVAGVNGADDVLIDSQGGLHVYDDIEFGPDPFTGGSSEQSFFDMTDNLDYNSLPEVQVQRPQRGAEAVDIGRTETPGTGDTVPAEIPGDRTGELVGPSGQDVGPGDNRNAGPDTGESIYGRDTDGLSERVRPDKSRVSERLLNQRTRNRLKARGVTSTALHEETDPQRFSSALDAARENNPYKLFVDPQSPADLEEKGAIMLKSADGKIVGAVGTKGIYEGDIFGVCKDPSSKAHNASRSIIIQAIAQGGNKLDCYNGTEQNPGLPRMYSSVGMIPVARVAFADAIADPSWNYERDGRPDVIFWMLKPGETAESVIQKYGKPESEGGFHQYTMEELAKLPLFDDTVDENGNTVYGYDRAWAYRDAKLAAGESSIASNPTNSTTGGDIQALNLGGDRQATPTQRQAKKVKDELQSPQKIAMKLANDLGFGNYIGSNNFGNLSSGVRGYWSRHAQLLAVKNKDIGDYTVTFHELGHGLAQKLNLRGTPQMVTNMLDAEPGFLTHYSEVELADEAMAEFMWRWMESEDRAVDFAGQSFVDTFERQLAARSAINSVVQEARSQFQRYIEADTNAKIASRIEYENNPQAQGFKGIVKTLINEIADSTSVAADVDNAANTGGRLRRQALFANHSQKRAVMNLTDFQTDANGTIIGDGFAKMLSDTGFDGSNEENVHLLERYALLLHSLDRDVQQKPVFGRDLTTDERIAEIKRIEQEHPEIKRAEAAWQQFRHNFLQAWMVDTGYWTADFLQHLEEMYPHYVPTFRVRENEKAPGGTGFGRSAKRFTLHSATGGSENIYSPMYSFIGMVDQITSMVATNQIAQVFDDIYQHNEGMGVFGRLIPGGDRPALQPEGSMNAKQRQLAELLKGKIEGDLMQQVLDITESQPGVNQNNKRDANTLRVQRQDGTVVSYEIDNPELYKLLTGAQGSSGIRILQAVGKLTRTMSMLTTGSNPLFALRNAVRDYQNSVNYGSWASNYATGIPKWIAAFAEVARNSKDYQEYQALGGGGWQRIQQNNAKSMNEIRTEMFGDDRSNVGKTAKWALKKVWNTITMERLNEIIEQTSRFAEYKYGQQSRDTVEGRQKAFQNAQDVTVDFSRSGNSELAYVLKKVVPFFNASMQGVYRTGRQLTEAERGRVGTRLTKTIVDTALMSAIAAGLIKRYGDDDDKEEFMMLSSGVKANHLILPNPVKGEGQPPFLRIPLAQDPLGYAVHNLVTNAMMNGSDDEMAITLAATADVILDNLNPLGSGTIAQPFIDVSHNRTWYGSNLVRTVQADWADRGSQYNEDTPEIFKTMGRLFNASPEVVEYLAQQYTGFLGAMAIPALSIDKNGNIGGFDAMMNSAIKKWTTDPASSNDVTKSFYDMKSILSTITGEAKADRPQGLLLRSLTQEEVNQAYEEADKMLKSGGDVYRISSLISDTYKEIDKINANDTLTDDQKAIQTRELRLNMLEQVQAVNEKLQAYYKKYIQGETLIDSVFGSIRKGFETGKYAHVKTDVEKMPDIFLQDANSDYMQMAMSVYDSEGEGYHKASALPHPSQSFTLTDRYGNEDDYEIDEEDWPRYTEIYRNAYQKYLAQKRARWDAMSDKEQFNILKSAHSAGNKAIRERFAQEHGIKLKK